MQMSDKQMMNSHNHYCDLSGIQDTLNYNAPTSVYGEFCVFPEPHRFEHSSSRQFPANLGDFSRDFPRHGTAKAASALALAIFVAVFLFTAAAAATAGVVVESSGELEGHRTQHLPLFRGGPESFGRRVVALPQQILALEGHL